MFKHFFLLHFYFYLTLFIWCKNNEKTTYLFYVFTANLARHYFETQKYKQNVTTARECNDGYTEIESTAYTRVRSAADRVALKQCRKMEWPHSCN